MPAHRFDDAPEFYSVQEIGTLLGLTKQRVNRIERKAIRKLWNKRLADLSENYHKARRK